MILLDTTILVYSVGTDHPLRDPCRLIVQAVASGRLTASTTVEVIQEFVHVRARRRDRQDAASLGNAFAELLSPLVSPGRAELENGFGLFISYPALGAFDAVLAAAAMKAGALASADSAFKGLPQLNHVDPGHPDLAETLGL
ncbi:MAG: type II toxin-antitoxin system VapC family toxin [Actinomycetota bacterium]